MSEGEDVRRAYDEPDIDHDRLIAEIDRMARGEYARASDASESAAVTKEFLELTNLNGQALSWLKSIVKKMPKKDGQMKAMDVIRSLEVGLPMVKSHVAGQGSMEMDLEGPDNEDHADDPQAVEPLDWDGDKETAEFEDAADDALGDDTVTPIDFAAGR